MRQRNASHNGHRSVRRGDGVAQAVDIGGVGGDIGCVLVNAVGIGSNIECSASHWRWLPK